MVRATAVMGMASGAGVLLAVIKMKLIAVLLGPAGVGLVGLLLNLVQTAAIIGSLGMGSVGARHIAHTRGENDNDMAQVRRALFWETVVLAALGACLFWIGAAWIAERLLLDPGLTSCLRWLSLGVALMIVGDAQAGALTGLRLPDALARVQFTSAVAGTFLGVAALWLWGQEGVATMILVAPLASLVVARCCLAPHDPAGRWRKWRKGAARQMQRMATQGVVFMLSAVVAIGGLLLTRMLVQRHLGANALGEFQAAWSIGAIYLAFALGAAGAEFFPRLTAAIADAETARRLVQEQMEAGLLLCAPILLGLFALAHVAIPLLYTDAFTAAAGLLRWQIAGDVLRVLGWPLGFVMLAAGANWSYTLAAAAGSAAFVGSAAALLDPLGIMATGVAHVAMQLCQFALAWAMARRIIGFRLARRTLRDAAMLILSIGALCALAQISEPCATVAGVVMAAGSGLLAFVRLRRLTGGEPTTGLQRLHRFARTLGRPEPVVVRRQD